MLKIRDHIAVEGALQVASFISGGAGMRLTSGDFTVDSGSITCNGDLNVLGHNSGQIFVTNAFQYPAPGTDWTPTLDGPKLAEGLSAKTAWLPLNFLKAGDEIVSYKLDGYIKKYSGETNTLDAQLYSINKGAPFTQTAIASGAIVQQTSGFFSAAATPSATITVPTTMTSSKMYTIQLTGTTGGSGHIIVVGAEVLVNRK